MAKRNGFSVHPGARISAQQIVLIAVSVLAIVLMITTLAAFNRSSSLSGLQEQQYDKLLVRYNDELHAIDILLSQQENESGDARTHTLHEIQTHVYAADALSIYKVDAYGGDPLMTTDAYSRLSELIEQSIQQLQSGNKPDEQIAEFSAALAELSAAGDTLAQ
jgi:hypothetical protein